jgi:hypothetical protein
MSNLYLPISMTFGFIAWGLVARWYLLPWAAGRSLDAALTPLLLLNVLRYVGLAFLIPGVTDQVLDSRFAVPAAWGDLLAAALALVALAAIKLNWRSATALLWVFNLFGAVDLVNAVLRGLRYTIDGHLGATYFIPALFVPLLLVVHVVIGIILLRQNSGAIGRPVTGLR